MLKTGHYGAALLCYAPVGAVLLAVDPALSVVGAVGSVALSRLPDYDLRVPLIEHRGVTHTLLFLVAVVGALGGVGHTLAGEFGADPALVGGMAVVVGCVGVGSHLLADALTPSGVPLLWPLSGRRFSVHVTGASNPVANYGLLALGVVATAAVVYLAG